MKSDLLFERDMLYPTDNSIEPGCIHAQVFGPGTQVWRVSHTRPTPQSALLVQPQLGWQVLALQK